MNDLSTVTNMVRCTLNREQMLNGFIENGLLTPEIEAMSDDDMAVEVAKNIIRQVESHNETKH